jgi:GTP cyclohydrolase IA
MKPKETLWNTPALNGNGNHSKRSPLQTPSSLPTAQSSTSTSIPDIISEIGDSHAYTSAQTPLRPDAFALPDEEKIALIADNFASIMQILGLDMTDDSLRGTPLRVAKMYVEEAFAGLNPLAKPKMTLFDNRYQYGQMLVEKDIQVYSHCEHHFVPIIGRAHVAYVPQGQVVGLSKLNRIVQYYAKRPQVQERLTQQIGLELQQALQTEHVAVVIHADHLCVASRGINDTSSSTITSFYSGRFQSEDQMRNEFLRHIERS